MRVSHSSDTLSIIWLKARLSTATYWAFTVWGQAKLSRLSEILHVKYVSVSVSRLPCSVSLKRKFQLHTKNKWNSQQQETGDMLAWDEIWWIVRCLRSQFRFPSVMTYEILWQISQSCEEELVTKAAVTPHSSLKSIFFRILTTTKD